MTPAQLRRLRKARGWTQAQAAEAWGVHSNTIARWERGELAIPTMASRLYDCITR